MIGVGVDAGSRAIKIALVNTENLTVLGGGMVRQGIHSDELARQLLEQVLESSGCGRSDVCRIVATGYARNRIDIADTTITEITCHARGVHHLLPDTRTIIEIGGQDSKLLRLDARGAVHDFDMNDRCAAGTGRFLEEVADQLGVGPEELGELSARSKSPASISSMCIVFAETEIIGLLASGATPEDIVAGVQNSIATRIATMIGKSIAAPVVFTGGVARIPGMDRALEEVTGQPVTIPQEPHMTGALGAALLAAAT